MADRFLVTTALEETWPAHHVPVLFLGEWCRLHERKFAWDSRDAIVASYHWDDRLKLHQDYLYLNSVYEDILKELAAQLNEQHQVHHTLRYWRVLIGPWLGYFIQMLFDRWSMINQVLHNEKIAGLRIKQQREVEFVPNDMADFSRMFISDEWNEFIYSQIIDYVGMPIEGLAFNEKISNKVSKKPGEESLYRLIKVGMQRAGNILFGMLCREDEYFFISSSMSIKDDLHLQAKLGQLPKYWSSVAAPKCKFAHSARQWKLHHAENSDEFLSLIRALIPRQIPKVYLEGYCSLVSLTKNLQWPKQPKAIFSSNSFYTADVFKAWAAHKIESGTPLVIAQHGGNYGMALWSFIEDHEMAIADKYLTWGWSEQGSKNITPVGNIKGFGKQSKSKEDGIALMVEVTFPRQSYHMYSVPVSAGQWLSYFAEQCRFVEALPKNLQNQLLIRLYNQDYDLGQKKRWLERFPDIKLDNGGQPISKLLNKTRLYVSTYNATTYLESLSLNFPTIIFWNPNQWELRDSACQYFNKLKSVGIFHETPEDAARHMAEVWNDIPGWWQSAEVQAARQAFCERYAQIPELPLEAMAGVFREIAKN
jgi:putative transferase (TIGR04331 family)